MWEEDMNRIKLLREQKGVRQWDMAEELGVSQGTLSNWERGAHSPDNNTLLILADYFGVTTDYILGKPENVTPLVIPEELKGIGAAFHRGEFEDLTQDEIEALAVIAKTLKAQRKL